jgi:hypothetical protein
MFGFKNKKKTTLAHAQAMQDAVRTINHIIAHGHLPPGMDGIKFALNLAVNPKTKKEFRHAAVLTLAASAWRLEAMVHEHTTAINSIGKLFDDKYKDFPQYTEICDKFNEVIKNLVNTMGAKNEAISKTAEQLKYEIASEFH